MLKYKITALVWAISLMVFYYWGLNRGNQQASEVEKASAIRANVANYYVVLSGNEPIIKFKYIDPADVVPAVVTSKIDVPEKTIRIFEPGN